jgi:hypothetical protein
MRFISKRKEFRLIIRPTEVVLDEARRPRVQYGEKVEFRNGVFNTSDKGLIDYLLHHPLYGLQYTSEIGNDPVEIEKHSLVFDDGAEITGPKLVAGRPTDMILGARATVDHPIQPEPIIFLEKIPKVITKEEPQFTRNEVEALIDSKLDAFLEKIGTLVVAPRVKKSRPKEFHCPICGKPFPSGMAVGKHKKEEHSN